MGVTMGTSPDGDDCELRQYSLGWGQMFVPCSPLQEMQHLECR